MAKGVKTGGRQKGVPNKKTAEVVAAAAESGLMPLDYMLSVLRDPESKENRKDWAAKEAAPYLHARRLATEHTGADGGPIALMYKWREPSKSTQATSPAKSSGRTMNGHNGSALVSRTDEPEKQ